MAEPQKERGVTSREPKEMEPWRTARSPFEEMERWLEESFSRPFFAPRILTRFGFPEMAAPQIDVYEDGNDVIVKAEIPGIKKDDLSINVKENAITISGEKKSEEKVERKDYYRSERSFGSFSRTVHLPSEIEEEKAKATFRDGVLEIRIPKSEQARQKMKTIPIE